VVLVATDRASASGAVPVATPRREGRRHRLTRTAENAALRSPLSAAFWSARRPLDLLHQRNLNRDREFDHALGAPDPSNAWRGTSFQSPSAGVVSAEVRDLSRTPSGPWVQSPARIAVTIELTHSTVRGAHPPRGRKMPASATRLSRGGGHKRE
jgi:hypothetical protein